MLQSATRGPKQALPGDRCEAQALQRGSRVSQNPWTFPQQSPEGCCLGDHVWEQAGWHTSQAAVVLHRDYVQTILRYGNWIGSFDLD